MVLGDTPVTEIAIPTATSLRSSLIHALRRVLGLKSKPHRFYSTPHFGRWFGLSDGVSAKSTNKDGERKIEREREKKQEEGCETRAETGERDTERERNRANHNPSTPKHLNPTP